MAIQRSTPTAITISTALNSLTSSTTAYAQSTEVSSGTSSNVTDIVANWTIVVGTITASASTRVNVYCWGTNDDTGYPGGSATAEVITGTAGSLTISANGSGVLRFLKSTLAHTTGLTMRDEASVVQALGFVPRRWGLVFQNQTGANLAASGHSAEYVETYYN
ncbi:MAG: hypothetical protein BWY21_00133 [Parcubacteria group bacterium ADurb.Bin216]|nr:MAG: hypothetical protein BWY21_00133 [Parcubacteria group bacterium ADurb.Bin216]